MYFIFSINIDKINNKFLFLCFKLQLNNDIEIILDINSKVSL